MGLNWHAGDSPVPGYRLIERLGGGGFGEVWKAEAPGGFHVALKGVSLADAAGKVEQRSLEVIRRIRHPQLVSISGTWQDETTLIIAMELADKTILDRFREAVGQGFAGIPEPEIHELFLDAAKGLDYLNEPRHAVEGSGLQGIQHRDIKPQNLLLMGGSMKVADYGLARVLAQSQVSHTGSMTPLYAAPEFFQGKTSSQSDQYSLAVTYCHMRGGRPPFSGAMAELMQGHLKEPPDLSMLPESERPAVARALSKAPRNRWPSCRAFVEAIRIPAERHETISLTNTKTWNLSSRKSRHRLMIGAAVVPIVACLAILAFIAFRPGHAWDSAHRRFEQGVTLYAKNDLDGAIRALTEAIELAPNYAEAYDQRGEAWLYKQEFEKASADYDEAIRLDPRYAKAYTHRGFLSSLYTEHDKAIADHDRAIRIDPDLVIAYLYRGQAWYGKEDFDKAIADFDTALRLEPTSAAAYGERGNVWHMRKDFDKAIADYTEAIRLDPRNACGYSNRSYAYRDKGDTKRAEEDMAEYKKRAERDMAEYKKLTTVE